ncbi:PQ-loop repeat-containing protein [Candidatus Dependentiae bacterium]|nr:PQ-loop repeat-containing protein [Candidatus Dependentiae bacterium]MBU4387624.1 PQ-loop repeat-containing protein [Candidatus Dependentiae bacterium]MCG2756463.1 PQ-loop repeat-containing protein [Candidatus Dependentiae bacterium]
MNFNNFFPWIAQIIFFLGLLPQIRLNLNRKSTKGLSDFLFIGYFYGYSFYMFYVFCLNLPLAHKIMVPLAFFAVLTLVFQRFYYSESKDLGLKIFFIFSILFFIFLLFLSIKNSLFLGHASGWVMMLIWAIYQIPQLLKNYQNRSIKGLSFGLVSMIGFGNFVEFIVALFLGLPPQTYLNNLNGIFVYLIYLVQFIKFK